MDNNKVGIITEVGDLGLGFTELNEKDQEALKEQEQKEKDNKVH